MGNVLTISLCLHAGWAIFEVFGGVGKIHYRDSKQVYRVDRRI